MFVDDLDLFIDYNAIYFLILSRPPASIYHSLATVTSEIIKTHDKIIGTCIPRIQDNISKSPRV